MPSQSLLALIQQGGVALYPLGVCSILVVAIFLERLWAFSRIGRVPREMLHRAESLLSAGQLQDALRLLDSSPGPFARVAKAGLLHRKGSAREVADRLALACEAEIASAGRGLPVLGTIGNIAPFIGLFGTVIGIMRAFHAVAQRGSAEAAAVSGGIAEALIATALGLGVGIVAVIGNNWMHALLEGFRLRLEHAATEWAYSLQNLDRPSETNARERAA
ncbi:MAG: MotA/TolQ/ExbB proton channel family protein [Armatimonadetes bacterium]|nr:MotA/TolQ/ExbB proton channel family protein [Armatimonadota bacterium]